MLKLKAVLELTQFKTCLHFTNEKLQEVDGLLYDMQSGSWKKEEEDPIWHVFSGKGRPIHFLHTSLILLK